MVALVPRETEGEGVVQGTEAVLVGLSSSGQQGVRAGLAHGVI